jgi:hypothetical protein
MTCPYCAWILGRVVARSGAAGDRPGDGAVVVCINCKRPSVVEGGELRAETPDEHVRHLNEQAVTDVVALSLLREALGGGIR